MAGVTITRVTLMAGFILASMSLMVRPARACTCGSPPVCVAYWEVDAVFIGTAAVKSIGPGAQRAHFVIEQSFRGPTSGALEVISRGIGGSCDFGFTDRARYLVYARHREDGTWNVSLCSRTTTVETSTEDLAFIKSVAKDPSRGGAVHGVVYTPEFDSKGRPSDMSPLKDVRLELQGKLGRFTAGSDPHGSFEFPDLKPGRYRLTAQVPAGFEPPQPIEVEVKGPGACVISGISVTRKPQPVRPPPNKPAGHGRNARSLTAVARLSAFYIPPIAHDSWAVGSEAYVSLHFLGADQYAR